MHTPPPAEAGRGHRIEVLPASDHVTVRLNGQILAETRRPALLLETGLPARHYIPEQDVRMDLLVPSDTTSRCPFKGRATYWSARAGDDVVADVAWEYPDPIPQAAGIARHLCFYDDRVEVSVDEGAG